VKVGDLVYDTSISKHGMIIAVGIEWKVCGDCIQGEWLWTSKEEK